jgi:hypothetical protein
MAVPSPYRSLPPARRVALLTHEMQHSRESRNSYIQRMVSGGGGFRPETLKKWPPEQLAREIVRRGLETPHDEAALLQLLYVELEPQLQIDFLDGAGVRHEKGVIPEDLPAPCADAATVRRSAEALIAKHGDEARTYLKTIALYNGDAWPGLAEMLELAM